MSKHIYGALIKRPRFVALARDNIARNVYLLLHVQYRITTFTFLYRLYAYVYRHDVINLIFESIYFRSRYSYCFIRLRFLHLLFPRWVTSR